MQPFEMSNTPGVLYRVARRWQTVLTASNLLAKLGISLPLSFVQYVAERAVQVSEDNGRTWRTVPVQLNEPDYLPGATR
ncbi:MAG: hypothetical protein AAF656_00420 [Planctomycetota bacterium]